MMTNTTIEGLRELRLDAMAQGIVEQREQPDYASLSFEDRLGLLVDRELLARGNRRLTRVLRSGEAQAPRGDRGHRLPPSSGTGPPERVAPR